MLLSWLPIFPRSLKITDVCSTLCGSWGLKLKPYTLPTDASAQLCLLYVSVIFRNKDVFSCKFSEMFLKRKNRGTVLQTQKWEPGECASQWEMLARLMDKEVVNSEDKLEANTSVFKYRRSSLFVISWLQKGRLSFFKLRTANCAQSTDI